MKSLLLTIAFVLAFLLSAHTQSCLPDGITFTTQGQIDSFPINYPGCTEIGGNVIVEWGNYLNLDGLASIQRIDGDLNISGAFDDYSGLVELIEVNGSFRIFFLKDVFEFDLPNLENVSGDFFLSGNIEFKNVASFSMLKRIGGKFGIISEYSKISGFNSLDSIGGDLSISSTYINGFNFLKYIGGNLFIYNNLDTNFIYGFNSLVDVPRLIFGTENIPNSNLYISGFNSIKECFQLSFWDVNLHVEGKAFNSLKYIKENLEIMGSKMDSLNFLNSIDSLGGGIFMPWPEDNYIGGLNNLKKAEYIYIEYALNPIEIGVFGSEVLETSFLIYNSKIKSFSGLKNLKILNGYMDFNVCIIDSFSGLDSLRYIEGLVIDDCSGFEDFEGLNGLDSIGYFHLIRNQDLKSLFNLQSLTSISENFSIKDNPQLSECSISAICTKLYLQPESATIKNNTGGCNSEGEVLLGCGIVKDLIVDVKLLGGFDCLSVPDSELDEFIFQVQSEYYSYIANNGFSGSGKFFIDGVESSLLTLPEFPTNSWAVCQDSIIVDPTLFGDTVNVTFLLIPLVDCPDLSCNLVLPPSFRSCLVETPVSVSVQNIGTIPAENSIAAIVLPMVEMDVVSSNPSPSWTNGDTLFYTLGDLGVFERSEIDLIVKTKCDTFLFGQTLCVEAFATLDNPCDPDPPIGSIVTIHPECIGDTLVEFTLTNIGDAPTMNDHDYFIIEDEVILKMAPFTLNPMQQMTVQVQADGSTFRMEATKLDDGTLTAAAIEGCGGLNPGLINAYWVDQGEAAYDMDCREVRLAYDPNEKSAVPTGVGPEHLMVANRPIQYTIDFQNTGTDTAYRVLIRDVLPAQLDVTSFRPLFATHDYTWQISGNDTLEFLFQPIALPDSATSQEGSKGFVTFTIDQLPDLPDGTTIHNTANIIFDFNPPITTNTVTHTIGKLLVNITTPTSGVASWEVRGNPMTQSALFKSKGDLEGENQFILTDISGRIIQSTSFLGAEYVFHRNGLSAGMYFFRIVDTMGGICAGRIVIAD